MSQDEHEALPVFLAANDAYACFAATTMMSIAETTWSRVDFHLFDDGIAPFRRVKLSETIARYPHATLEFHDDLDRSLDVCVSDWYRTRAIFSRYRIADQFPSIDLAMYVDVDTIVLSDIAELFAAGTCGKGLAACSDMAINTIVDVERHKRRLGIATEHDYFNNGVILIHGPFWRQQRVADALTDIALDRREAVVFPSQDPMNIFFSPNQYHRLPQRWNYMPSGFGESGEPALIHFTVNKPWNEPHLPEADRFWSVASRSPFLGEIIWRRRLWRIVKPLRRFRRTVTRWMGRQPGAVR